MAIDFIYPPTAKGRGRHFWLMPGNWVKSRRKFRRDGSVEWRKQAELSAPPGPTRSRCLEDLLGPNAAAGHRFRFVVLADSGEGDASQVALLPLIRALAPNFMIINGDIAYPAGEAADFTEGFFKPYRNLGIPVWAVPGNHEYYSTNNGREFYEVFCSDIRRNDWDQYGLRLVKQPGMYWELRSPRFPLIVLGLDSGMTASLDSDTPNSGDPEQLTWLRERLAVARARDGDKRILVLFHIPALCGEKRVEEGLDELYSILAAEPMVRAIVTGHEHAFQYYGPGAFHRFAKSSTAAPTVPHYFVSGCAGAGLSAVTYLTGSGEFGSDRTFPDKSEWDALADPAQRAAAAVRVNRTWLGKAIDAIGDMIKKDPNDDRYLSLISVDVFDDGRATLTPYLQQSLAALYQSQPGLARVDVQNATPSPLASDVDLFGPLEPKGPGSIPL